MFVYVLIVKWVTYLFVESIPLCIESTISFVSDAVESRESMVLSADSAALLQAATEAAIPKMIKNFFMVCVVY